MNEREAFEAWAKGEDALGTVWAWKGWQAASAGRAELVEALKDAEREVGVRMSNALIRRVLALIEKHGA